MLYVGNRALPKFKGCLQHEGEWLLVLFVKFRRIVAGGHAHYNFAYSFTDTLPLVRRNPLEILHLEVEPMAGIEPATDGLRNRCSTTELHWQTA